jgi:hypothetical protein
LQIIIPLVLGEIFFSISETGGSAKSFSMVDVTE